MKIHRKVFFSVFAALVAILYISCWMLSQIDVNTVASIEQTPVSQSHVIVLDSGHGGIDGGAQAGDILEKEINLAIALKLRDMLTSMGYEVIMTRETDISLHDADKTTVKSQKTSDLKNRLKIIEENPDCLFISIHQNKFNDTSCKGAQMFYGKNNPNSQLLAQSIQDNIVNMLQPENTRAIKKGESNLFLLYKAQVPAVLIECGFLSNPQESKLLSDDEYQSKLAFAILTAIMQYEQTLRTAGQSPNAV